MMPVTTEYPIAEIDAFSFDRAMGHVAIGILVGCAVALILCFLVITFQEPAAGHPGMSAQGGQARSSQLLVRPEQRLGVDTGIVPTAVR